MKTRLTLFAAALLLLPPTGFLVGGHDWEELATSAPFQMNRLAVLATIGTLATWTLLGSFAVGKRTGNHPLKSQRGYYLAMAITSAATGWLLVHQSRFVSPFPHGGATDFLLLTLSFLLAGPALLVGRALFGSFPALLKTLARGPGTSAPPHDIGAMVLIVLAGLCLMGAPSLPSQQGWLIWAGPLLLLFSLQLMWHERTILRSLEHGDWSRPICAALAGLAVGNLAMMAFGLAGGMPPDALASQSGYALAGLLNLQLGDVIAGYWRNRKRQAPKRKPFPIPVVVKKN